MASFRAIFQKGAGFSGATFRDVAWFDRATFQDSASFSEATFAGSFTDATFAGDNETKGVAEAYVLHLDDLDLNKRRLWPNGYTVCPDPADPTRGTLIAADQDKIQPAVSGPDPADNELGSD